MSEKTKTYGAVVKIRINGAAVGSSDEAETSEIEPGAEVKDGAYEYRSVYVEAGDETKAGKRIRECVAAIYEVDPYAMRFVQYPSVDYYPAANPLFLTRHALFDVNMIKSLPEDLADRAPWKEMGVSRRTWYRRFKGCG